MLRAARFRRRCVGGRSVPDFPPQDVVWSLEEVVRAPETRSPQPAASPGPHHPESPPGDDPDRDTEGDDAGTAEGTTTYGSSGSATGPAGPILERWRAALSDPTSGARLSGQWPDVMARWREALRARPAALVAIACLGVALGSVWFALAGRSSDEASTAPTLAPLTSEGTTASSMMQPTGGPALTVTTVAEVVAHAAGAVQHPGVYRLPGGSRASDLVEAAGGFAPGADTNRVNLAAPLPDGGRLYVPRVDEATTPTVVAADGGGGGGGGGAPASGPSASGAARAPAAPVNINTASATELDTLPGIGPATSAAIIDHRTQHGPFRSVEDLTNVRGIGKAKLEQIRSRVTT